MKRLLLFLLIAQVLEATKKLDIVLNYNEKTVTDSFDITKTKNISYIGKRFSCHLNVLDETEGAITIKALIYEEAEKKLIASPLLIITWGTEGLFLFADGKDTYSLSIKPTQQS